MLVSVKIIPNILVGTGTSIFIAGLIQKIMTSSMDGEKCWRFNHR